METCTYSKLIAADVIAALEEENSMLRNLSADAISFIEDVASVRICESERRKPGGADEESDQDSSGHLSLDEFTAMVKKVK